MKRPTASTKATKSTKSPLRIVTLTAAELQLAAGGQLPKEEQKK